MGLERSLETEIYEALIDLMEIAAKLTGDMHSDPLSSETGAYFVAATLNHHLRDWYGRLTPRLKWAPEAVEQAPLSYFLLHQQYHTTFILLHRPFTTRARAEVAADGEEKIVDVVLEASRKVCFDHAIEVARIFGIYCQRFDIRTMFVTGMQHAATAALAIVEGMSLKSSYGHAEPLLHLQCLAEALHAHAVAYLPAKRMSDLLFNVIGEYQTNQARRQESQIASKPSFHRQGWNDQIRQDRVVRDHTYDVHTIGSKTATEFRNSRTFDQDQLNSSLALLPEQHNPSTDDDAFAPYHSDPGMEGVVPVEICTPAVQENEGVRSGLDLEDNMQDRFLEYDSELWENIMNTLSQPLNDYFPFYDLGLNFCLSGCLCCIIIMLYVEFSTGSLSDTQQSLFHSFPGSSS